MDKREFSIRGNIRLNGKIVDLNPYTLNYKQEKNEEMKNVDKKWRESEYAKQRKSEVD